MNDAAESAYRRDATGKQAFLAEPTKVQKSEARSAAKAMGLKNRNVNLIFV